MSNAQGSSGLSSITTSNAIHTHSFLSGSDRVCAKSLQKNFFVNWFEEKGREFPWRDGVVSPFAFLVTEILLRQTGARSVARLWSDFVHRYPDAQSMLKARRPSLIRKLKVLGFGNQRAEALQEAAKHLIEHHNGFVPQDLNQLLKVPHIGNYAARAVLCFAFNRKVEIVDTNILRFFSRYYGLTVKPDIRRNPVVWAIAQGALPRQKNKAAAHNYGLLDFTAEVCKALQPKCTTCPLNTSCNWGRRKLSEL
jgi:A/G-specific adenine glycosylase